MGFKTLAPKAVTAANTATRITTTVTPCQSVTFQADPDNVNLIWVGDVNVGSSTTDRGFALSTTDGDAFPSSVNYSAYSGANPINLADFYVMSASATAKININYIEV